MWIKRCEKLCISDVIEDIYTVKNQKQNPPHTIKYSSNENFFLSLSYSARRNQFFRTPITE